MYKKNLYLTAIAFYLASQTSVAQVAPIVHKKDEKDSLKNIELPQVVVYSKAKERKDYTLVARKELDVMQSQTLGETLSKIPGIQNSYFGPNSGTPVIRSLSGSRIKILNNGLGINDLSGISPDININIDQDNIQSMEIHKGSATVLYGGRAIGGAVNIKSNVIPVRVNEKKITGTASIEGSSNNGFKQSFYFNGNAFQHFSWHIGGMNYKNESVKIPGNTKPDYCYDPEIIGFDSVLQALSQMNVNSENVLNITLFPYINQFALDHMNDPEYDLSENDKYTFKETYYDPKTYKHKPNPKNDKYVPGQDPDKDRYKPVVKSINDYVPVEKGVIPNSHSKANSLNAGFSYIGNSFIIGMGYQGNYAYYGIPAFAQMEMPKHTHTHADGTVHTFAPKSPYLPINVRTTSHMGMLQTEIKKEMPVLSSIKFNLLGQLSTDKELLANKMANQFDVQRQAVRLELQQKKWGFLSGTTGVDYDHRKMEGEGSLRFLPNNHSYETGFFTLQHFAYKFLQADLGYRHDEVKRKAHPDAGYKKGRGLAGGNLSTRQFGLNQLNGSLKLNLWKEAHLTAAYTHSERAPEVNELYAGNNHFAIVVEENGDDKLGKEMANTIELGGGFNMKGLTVSVNWYKTSFKNYLYLGHTGVFRSGGFLVKEWRAADTRIEGIEAQVAYKQDLQEAGKWEVSSYFDLVKNKDVSKDHMRRSSDGDYMPNMPTSRLGFGLTGSLSKWIMNVAFDRYLKQKYLGKHISNEHASPAYNLLSARVSYDFSFKKVKTEFYLYGTNLLNVEARQQNSHLKYLAPLPGINIGGGIKLKI